jgi:hypothetical protein
VVSRTGSYEAGLMVVIMAGALNVVALGLLAWRVRY